MAFDDRVETMHPVLVPASVEKRESARAFLKQIDARGGTELSAGVAEAARVLGGQGDVIIITDGQVFGTETILAQAGATGIRLFCLGIGSASQDRFLSLLARETGGISRFVTARERVDLAAVDLFASIGRPVAAGLKATIVQPEPPHLVFAGNPILLFGEIERDGCDRVEITWDGGNVTLDVPSGDPGTGEAVRLLRGSRLITDWESRYPGEEASAPLEKRRQSRVAARLVDLSQTFGLASREMALVAVVKRLGDRAGELPETRVVPVGMPAETLLDACFPQDAGLSRSGMLSVLDLPLTGTKPEAHILSDLVGSVSRLFSLGGGPKAGEPATSNADLFQLATMLNPDGGMPGDNHGVRLGRTIAAVFAFVANGHTLTAGAFRLHVARLVEFLKSINATEMEARLIETAVHAASTGKAPPGEWTKLACKAETACEHVEAAIR
jgi:hypothetical protein